MSIEYYIGKYINQANELVKENLDFHIQNTNNIDEVIKEIVKDDFTNDDNLSELDEDLLYHYLTASKVLAQLAWNNYRHHMCFSNCEIDENYFYQICHHLENAKFYKTQFEKIKEGIKYSETSITEIISRYFIISYILKSRQVDVENIKICVYCDNEEIGDICSVCDGNQFCYKDDWPVKISPSAEPQESNSNLENESIYCHKESLLNTKTIESNRLNFHSEYIFKSDNEAEVFDQCFPDKTIDGDKIEICKIKSQSLDTMPERSLPSLYKESQLSDGTYSCNFSNKNDGELAKNEQFENLNKENENSNNYLLFGTSHKCNFNRNEESVQFCTLCKIDKINNESDNKTNPKLTDIKTEYSLSRDNIDAIDTNQWICTQCSLINNKHDDICVLCYTNKDNVNYDLPEETWNCKKCNERNPFNCYKCHKCSAFSDFFDKWVCEKCSYFNDRLESNCNVCNMQNHNLIKCPKCKVININTKYDDICVSCKINDLLNKTSQLSINISDDQDTMVKSNSKPSMISNDNGKVGIKHLNCFSDSFESKQRELKIKSYTTSNKSNLWFCTNPRCCGVNFKRTTYCDKCHLKKDFCPSNNAVCAFFKNNREIFKWYCTNCESFNNPSSLNCSVCNNYQMKITEV